MSEYGNPVQDEPGGRYENAPFKKGLENMFHPFATIGVSNEILVNAEAQGLVVRAADLDMYYEHTDEDGPEQATPAKDAEHIQRVEAAAAKAKEVYDELASEYGINIPKFMYVIGEARYVTGTDSSDPDAVTYMTRWRSGKKEETIVREQGDTEPMLYTVSEQVVGGWMLQHVHRSPEKPTYEEYSTLYETMTRYYVDKYLNKESFYSDFGGMIRMDEQFMFGHIENKDDALGTEYANKIWLTDVDPKVFDPAEVNDEDFRQTKLTSMLFTIIRETKQIPDLTKEGLQHLLGLVHEQIQRLMDDYPEAAEKLLKEISQ